MASLPPQRTKGRYKLSTLSNRHIRKVAGQFTSGALSANWTHNACVAADQPFEWARIWVTNASTSVDIVGVKALVAVTDTATSLIRPTQATVVDDTITAIGVATGWHAVTWDSGSTSTTVPMCAAAAGGTETITLKASDWMRIKSVARTDVANALPICLGRVLVPSSGNTVQTTSSQIASSWAPTSGRFFKVSREQVDAVTTTPANYTQTGEGTTCAIAGIEFRGSLPSIPVLTIGDSTYEGYLLTKPQDNWGFQYTDAMATLGYPISHANVGWTGAKSIDIYNIAKTHIANFKPAIVFYLVGTSNDGVLTQAIIDRQYAQAIDIADYCSENDVVCVLTTMIPNSSTTAPQDAFRLALNARILAQKNPVADFSAAVGDGATPERIITTPVSFSSGDATPHPNLAGHAAMAVKATNITLSILSSNPGIYA